MSATKKTTKTKAPQSTPKPTKKSGGKPRNPGGGTGGYVTGVRQG